MSLNPASDSLYNSATRRAPSGQPGGSYYMRLMQVDLRHRYYNASGYLCPDFDIAPTGASRQLMQSLGLLFLNEGVSFSVLLNTKRQDAFFNYLRSREQYEADGKPWTRLSFTLTLANGSFLNFTDLPIDRRPGESAYYLSSSTAKIESPNVVLDPSAEAGTRLTGAQFRFTQRCPQAQSVGIFDVSGALVSTTSLPPVTSPPTQTGGSVLYLDFAQLPEGKYTIVECAGPKGQEPIQGPQASQTVLYCSSAAQPFFFIDLFFTNPGLGTGVYPIDNLNDPAKTVAKPIQYTLQMDNRKTTWNYYIVSQGAPLNNLAIVPQAPSSVRFTGPVSVVLPNLQAASLFRSDSPVALEEQSTSDFQLRGRAGVYDLQDSVLMRRLPVASAQMVIVGMKAYATTDSTIPTTSTPPGSVFSDIYVYV